MRPVTLTSPDRRIFALRCASLAASARATPGASLGARLAGAGAPSAATLSAATLPGIAQAQGSLDGDTDVPYVITPQTVVDAMLELAAVGPLDHLIDLGSGDGRIVILSLIHI